MTDDEHSTSDEDLAEWASMVPRPARRFQGQRAGFVTRVLANLVDMVVVAFVLAVLYGFWTFLIFTFRPGDFHFPDVSMGLVLVAGATTSWLYLTSAWATTGRSFGAKLMGIRVVGARRQVMLLAGAAIRAAFCIAFMPGLFWVIVSNENRSLQDTVLRTSVIHDWTKRAPKHESKRRERE